MATFEVDVSGATYEVDAPDERTAWRWANVEHAKTAKQKPAKPAFELEAEKTRSYTPSELIAGSAPVRFAMGAASPFLGLAQLISRNPIGKALGQDKWIDEKLRVAEALKRRGMEAYGQEGVDVAGIAGAVMSPAALGAAKALPAAATVLGKMGQGAGVGAGFGASTPVTEEGDFATQKAIQTGTGAVAGALIPGGWELAKGAGRAVRETLDLVLPRGAERIATRYLRGLVGKENIDDVAEALAKAREAVPGAKPTAAEAVAELPAGSPIIAQQRITAATPGGISAKFGQRALDQKEAIAQAIEARAAATDPMRRAALGAANAGGVRSDAVISGIDATLSKPGLRASDVVGRTLNSVKEKIASLTDEATGVINADDLYTIRKEVGNTIKTHAKDTANWDKRLTAGLERDIQKNIDDAIEAAGGRGWKDYLREFSERSKGIEADLARKKAMLRPAQRTDVGGGVNIAEETRSHIPQMLSRTAMIANAILKALSSKKYGIEPRVDEIMAEGFLNPQQLSQSLKDVPPAQRQAIVDALMQLRFAPVGAAATAAGQTQ